MTVQEYEKKIKEIVSEIDLSDIHTSPDFQCDQTGCFPTALCACFEKGMAWLTLNAHLAPDGVDITPTISCIRQGAKNMPKLYLKLADGHNIVGG